MTWNRLNDEERNYILKKFLPKEICSVVLTGILDLAIIAGAVFMIIRFHDIITVFLCIFFAWVLYVTINAIVKSIRTFLNIHRNKMTLAKCVLKKIETKSVDYMFKSSYVTLESDSGESYSMNYTSPYVSKIFEGQPVYLVNFGSSVEMIPVM